MIDHDKQGKNLSDVQEINRSLVLNTLRENPDCSRSDIAKSTGLRQATITKIINDFIDWGIVVETKLIKNDRGRRSIGLELNSNHYRIICLRLLRTQIKAGVYDISGKEYLSVYEPINISAGSDKAMDAMIKVIHSLMDATSGQTLLGIGVGLPGPYLRKEGILTIMADFPGWEDHNIQTSLEQEFGKLIYIEHDAQANALAEWWFGRQRNLETALLSISMEEGLGAGLIVDGKIYYGTQGIAGEIGHISIDYNGIPCPCGNRGCLRNYCSDTAIVKKALSERKNYPNSALNGLDTMTLSAIIQAALDGDTFSYQLIQDAGTYLGYGLITAIYAYNPDIIILSRQFSQAGDLFLEAVRKVLDERLLPSVSKSVRIVFSKIAKDPVLMGMVALVTDSVFMNPASIISFN